MSSLADARRRRDDARKLLADGVDPIDRKKRARAEAAPVVTFGAFADELIPEIVKGFRNPKHKQQWKNALRDHASSNEPIIFSDGQETEIMLGH